MVNKRYLLMNKDVKVAEFHIAEGGFILIDKQFVEVRYWMQDLPAFIVKRRAPKHRANITELLKASGCNTIEGYLDISYALSLVDTFWVKPIDSELRWKDVSLYTHDFNEVIAKTAFEGGLHGHDLSTTSPEYGTDGHFAKCWIREEGQIRMLKRGSSGKEVSGLEPYSEYYSSQVVKYFKVPYVEYSLRSVKGHFCSVCDIFTSDRFGYLPYYAVDPNYDEIETIIYICSEMGFEKQVKAMFVLDAIIMNIDRHKNNFGFLIDNEKQEVVDFAPLFDHNLALLPYAKEYEFDDQKNFLVFQRPRLGDDFIDTARYCLTPELRDVLISLLGFQFERHPEFQLPDWRLNASERLIQKNIQKILS